MDFLKYFKIGFIGIAFLLLSCYDDDIKILDSEYISGGIGTSENTGAVEFNFTIPENYSSARVGIDLVGNISVRKEVYGNGDKQPKFSDLSSGIFNYTFEFWAIDNTVGNLENSPLGILLAITETLEVRQGKTLKIRIAID